jgi:hypothetical protein
LTFTDNQPVLKILLVLGNDAFDVLNYKSKLNSCKMKEAIRKDNIDENVARRQEGITT